MVIGFLRGIRFWDGSPLIRGPVPCLAGWGLSLLALAVAPAAHGQTLSAGDVTETTATLTISGHTSAWYHKRTSPSAGISVANLASLTGGRSYTWKAYSHSACATELASASFTTISYTASNVTATNATLTIPLRLRLRIGD